MTRPDMTGRISPADRLRASRIPALFVISLLVLGTTFERLRNDRWDTTYFITIGRDFATPAKFPAPVTVVPGSGYDGQFFYRLALDPFVTRTQAFGLRLDSRPVRVGRIGYPLIAWALSLGRPRWVPYTLILSNLAALLVIAWVGMGIAARFGRSIWFGLLLPAWPGFLLSIARDTAEIDAACFGVLAISGALARRPWQAALFGSAAVLTRESALFYLAGFGIVALWTAIRRASWSRDVALFAAPAFVLAIWQLVLLRITGGSVYADTGSGDLGAPFVGEANFLASRLHGVVHDLVAHRPMDLRFETEIFEALSAIFCTVFPLLPLAILFRRGTPPALLVSWFAYLALCVCFAAGIWSEPWGYLRILADCFTVTAVLLLASPATAPLVTLAVLLVPVWIGSAWFVWS